MNDTIMVSITCITYNHRDFIRDMFEGVLAQNTQYRFELIVHDDASTDGTADIIREYAERYPDIVIPIFEEENQYSKGVDVLALLVPYIRGRYVANCDGDDYWVDHFKLQKQVDYMLDHPNVIGCCTNASVVDYMTEAPNRIEETENEMIKAHYAKIGRENELWCAWRRNHYVTVKNIDGTPIIKPSTWMIKAKPFIDQREFISKLGGYLDLPLQLWMVSQSKVFYSAEVTTVYRLHYPGSWSYKLLTGNVEKRKDELELEDHLVDVFNALTDYVYDDMIQKRRNRYIYRRINNEQNMDLLSTIGVVRVAKAGCIDIALAVLIYKYVPVMYKGIRKVWRRIIGEK